jgi:hypothetical protein
MLTNGFCSYPFPMIRRVYEYPSYHSGIGLMPPAVIHHGLGGGTVGGAPGSVVGFLPGSSGAIC